MRFEYEQNGPTSIFYDPRIARRPPLMSQRYAGTLPLSPGDLISAEESRQGEKRTLLAATQEVIEAIRVATAHAGFGILTEFPFGDFAALPAALGSTNPCTNAVHMEPFSSSALKVLI